MSAIDKAPIAFNWNPVHSTWGLSYEVIVGRYCLIVYKLHERYHFKILKGNRHADLVYQSSNWVQGWLSPAGAKTGAEQWLKCQRNL